MFFSAPQLKRDSLGGPGVDYSTWRDAKSRGAVGLFAAFLILVSAAYLWVNWSSHHGTKAILVGVGGIVSGFILIRLLVGWGRAA